MAYVKVEVPVSRNRHILYSPSGDDIKLEANQEKCIPWFSDREYTRCAFPNGILVEEHGEYKITLFQWNVPKDNAQFVYACNGCSANFESRKWDLEGYTKIIWTVCCFGDTDFSIIIKNKTNAPITVPMVKLVLVYELIT